MLVVKETKIDTCPSAQRGQKIRSHGGIPGRGSTIEPHLNPLLGTLGNLVVAQTCITQPISHLLFKFPLCTPNQIKSHF